VEEDSAAISASRIFNCARRDWRRDCLEEGCVDVVVGEVEGAAHESSMAALVLGPTTPQPVVAGVPEETML
jgi:hypothetical protein